MSDENQKSRIINPADYPPNRTNEPKKVKASEEAKSTEAPKERPKQEKVVSTEVVQRKKSLGRKITGLVTGDEAKETGRYLVVDILVPSIKSMLFDLITGGAERSLFGTDGGRRPRGSGPKKVAYDRMYTGSTRSNLDRPGGVRSMSSRGRATHDFDEIVIDSRGEADEILERMQDLINDYEVATVADLYDMAGIGSNIQDEQWGWSNLSGASVSRVRDGFVLNLPRTESLK